jgi:hypothetical protein
VLRQDQFVTRFIPHLVLRGVVIARQFGLVLSVFVLLIGSAANAQQSKFDGVAKFHAKKEPAKSIGLCMAATQAQVDIVVSESESNSLELDQSSESQRNLSDIMDDPELQNILKTRAAAWREVLASANCPADREEEIIRLGKDELENKYSTTLASLGKPDDARIYFTFLLAQGNLCDAIARQFLAKPKYLRPICSVSD